MASQRDLAFPTEPGYVGWLRPRPRGRWEARCQAPTWGECWALLLSLPREGLGRLVEMVVLPAGRTPR